MNFELNLLRKTFILSLLLLPMSLIAQEEEVDAYDDGHDSTAVTAYLAPQFYAVFPDTALYYFGGAGGLIFGERFILGGFYTGMVRNMIATRGEYRGYEMDMGGGGLMLGYQPLPGSKFRPFLLCQAGAGGISLSKNKIRDKDAYDGIWILNFCAGTDICFTKSISLSVGANYNRIMKVGVDGYSDEEFSGPGFYLAVKIGSF